MQKLAEACVRRPVFTWVLALAMVVLGAVSVRGLGVDRFPNIQFPFVAVTTVVPGSSPSQIEREVTDRVEEAVNTVSGIERLDSITSEGVSIVFAQFVLEKDVNLAAQEVRDRVNRVLNVLPPTARTPQVEAFRPNDAPIMLLSLEGGTSLEALSETARTVVRRRLEGLSGIGEVTLFGDRARRVRVIADLARMETADVTASELMAALASESVEAPAGSLVQGDRTVALRVRAHADTVRALGDVVVARRGDRTVRVHDLATVVDGVADPSSAARIHDRDVVVLSIRKRAGANTVAVVDLLRERVPEIEAALPQGVHLRVVRDESEYVRNALHAVVEHLVLGAVFAALAVLLFLRNGRSTVIAALAIPTSVVATFAMLKLADLTLDTITLLGLTLSVGIVIDDAIVVLENVVRYLESRDLDPAAAALEATREIGLAVLATTLSLVAVFLPVAFMQGIVGRFFRSFGLTMSFAIMVSLFVAFSLTPMLSARWLKRDPGHGAAAAGHHEGGALERGYVRVLAWAMRHRAVVMVALGLTFLSIVPLGGAVNKNFLPVEDESRFEVTLRFTPGTSLAQSTLVADRLARSIRGLEGVERTVVTAGSPLGDASGRGPHDASIYVGLHPPSARAKTQNDIMDAARRVVLARPEGYEAFVAPVDVFGGGGVDAATIQFVVRGPNLSEVRGYAERLQALARGIAGTTDHSLTALPPMPELSLVPDREAIGGRGLRVASVVETVQALSTEPRVGTMEIGGEAIAVHLALGEAWRRDPARVLQARVRDLGGGSVLLRELVTVQRGEGPSTIRRLNRQRQITVGFNIAQGSSEQTAIDTMRRLSEQIRVAPGYTIEPAGNSKELEKAGIAFMIAVFLSLMFMYLVLAAQFESWLHPVTILASLPLTVPFALLSLLLTRDSLNVYSALGLLVLFGIVKKNSILQVERMRQLRDAGVPQLDAVLQGNRERLRPILMTTLAFVAGMLPLVLSKGAGSATNRTIAVTVMGGQTLCLVLTLVATPVLYTLFEDLRGWRARRRATKNVSDISGA
jgi:HAE1 family hydrophobic/amphiphilic exporter-1